MLQKGSNKISESAPRYGDKPIQVNSPYTNCVLPYQIYILTQEEINCAVLKAEMLLK